MAITYSIAIDYDDDGTFTELNDNITSDILRAAWRLGMADPYEHVSEVATAAITVRNQDMTFSPDDSNLLIGKRLRIQSDDESTVRTHFIGFIDSVEPQTGNQGQRLAVVHAVGREAELAQHRVRLPFQTDVRADEALADVLNQIPWRYDVLDGMCIIGLSSIGSSTIFPTDAITQILDTGKSVFAFLADDWADGLPANEAVRQLTTGEGGRFFFNRDGEAVFYNRHHLLTDDSVVATFEDDMAHLAYAFGGVVNDVQVSMKPRSIGASNQVIWSLAQAMTLRVEETVQIIARYRYDDEPVGALDLVTLQSNTHYVANSARDSSGQDRTSDIQVVIIEASMSAAVIEIRNRSQDKIYLTQLNLHGTPIIVGDRLTLTNEDKLSAALYGKRTMHMDMPVITDIDEAQGIVDWELLRRSEPRGRVRALHTHTRNHPTETLALTLFDRIRVIESQTGHDENYHIVAEAHEVDMGGTRHRVAWLLEPAESSQFFIIGTHSIGDDVVLVPR